MNGRSRATPPAPSQLNRSRVEVLLVSAFATLPSTPPEMVDAVTLSMPVADNDEAAALWKLALELAGEYDVHADFAVSRGHLIVRVTRRLSTEGPSPPHE
jgi:hypothetical protein